jgi:DNA primase large subunit
MEGLDFAVRYPFSDSARKSIEGLSLTERIVELAVERIKKALKGDTAPRMLLHEAEKKEDIASFAAARMILGTIRNNFLTNRFAVNESKTASRYLEREDGGAVDSVAARFGISTKAEGGRLLIDLPTYLRFSLRNPDYKLINRRLVAGMVEVTDHQKKRLIEEAIKQHNEDIPLVKDPPDIIKKAGARVLAEIPKSESRITVKIGDHPPCIMRLLDEAKKHQNLPHHARWYLATYLLAIGMGEDDIVKVYSDLPDFSEKVTRYQVSHIRKKGYSVPSCATVMTYGLCCAVCRIGSPINWHTLTQERKNSIKAGGG